MQYITFILATLFTIPDARIFGLTSLSILFLFLIGLLFIMKNRILMSYLKLNSPFLFLFLFSILILIYLLPTMPIVDIKYLIVRNKDLFTEILLSFVLFSIFNNDKSFHHLKLFIKTYFLLNFIYFVIKELNVNIIIFFHNSINNVYNLSNFTEGREPFLGWEPSYTVPVSILFCLIYFVISENMTKKICIGIFTLIIIFLGMSKTSFILVFIIIMYFIFLYIHRGFKNKLMIKFSMIVTLLISLLLSVYYLEVNYHIFTFDSTNKAEQFEMISFLTRSQLILETLNQIANFPLGYGVGNSIVVLSEYIDSNIMDFLTSYEIVESAKYARTPKSQFLEYLLSGGIIFLLLYFYHLRYIYKYKSTYSRYNDYLNIIMIIAVVTIIVGERIPYILIMNIVFIIKSKELYNAKK